MNTRPPLPRPTTGLRKVKHEPPQKLGTRQGSIPKVLSSIRTVGKENFKQQNHQAGVKQPQLGATRTNRLWPRVLKASSPSAKGLPSIERHNTSVAETKPKVPVNNEYEIGKQIGQGAYAVVKEAMHKGTKEKFAIKIYEKYKLLDPQRRKSVSREINILKKLSHSSIVKLIETIDTAKQLMLVTELVKGRSLYSYVKSKEGRKVSEEEARRLLLQVVDGINYCHQRDVSHRDIKMENLLLDEHNNVKIIDFGFAACVPSETKLKVFCGTPSYMAPEIVNKQEYRGPPADMWSIGILMYALICGAYPFKAPSDRELYRKIARGAFSFPPDVSSAAQDLINRLLQVDPKKRPTSLEMLRDKFFTYSLRNEPVHKELYKKYLRSAVEKITNYGYTADEVLAGLEKGDWAGLLLLPEVGSWEMHKLYQRFKEDIRVSSGGQQ